MFAWQTNIVFRRLIKHGDFCGGGGDGDGKLLKFVMKSKTNPSIRQV